MAKLAAREHGRFGRWSDAYDTYAGTGSAGRLTRSTCQKDRRGLASLSSSLSLSLSLSLSKFKALAPTDRRVRRPRHGPPSAAIDRGRPDKRDGCREQHERTPSARDVGRASILSPGRTRRPSATDRAQDDRGQSERASVYCAATAGRTPKGSCLASPVGRRSRSRRLSLLQAEVLSPFCVPKHRPAPVLQSARLVRSTVPILAGRPLRVPRSQLQPSGDRPGERLLTARTARPVVRSNLPSLSPWLWLLPSRSMSSGICAFPSRR